ncbi:MAG: PrsW family intramembrane metalloprotease [Anaerolineaceae bacterium]|nr:PrsW family intramembrane metalloprotease [Anaerolineaceae bacterium]
MILLITIPLAIGISLLWYYPGIKAQGENRVLTTKDYLVIALKYGFLFTSLLIMITEIIWDGLVKRTPLTGLALSIVSDFFRAALLEEFFKFRGFILAKRKYKLYRKIDYIMTAGMMGLVYGVFEKIVLGNIAAVIVGLLCPMHIIWQFNQGSHYFEHDKAKALNDARTAQKELRLAVFVPFLFHGLWDSGLDIGVYMLEQSQTVVQVIGIVLITAMVIFGVVYSIKTVRRVCAVARNTPVIESQLPEEAEQNQTPAA